MNLKFYDYDVIVTKKNNKNLYIRVSNDLKIRMDSEKEPLSDIHESTKIRKKIIKKRLGL